MTLVLTFGGKQYLPLRAIPFVSGGVLDEETVVELIANPDGFCDAENNGVVSPRVVRPDGKLALASTAQFQQAGRTRTAVQLPPALLAAVEPVREKYELLKHLSPRGATTDRTGWSLDPYLTPKRRAYVVEGLPRPRVNSVPSLVAEIQRVYELIESQCAGQGLQLDQDRLPGAFKDWEPLFHTLSPSLRRSNGSTFRGHIKAAGLSWAQGRRPDAVAALKQATAILLQQAQ